MSASDLNSATIQSNCEALVNAAHVFAAHWEGNLTLPMNYLSDTAAWFETQLRFARRRPTNERYNILLTYARELLAATRRMEGAWEHGDLAGEARVLANVASAYEADYGAVPFYDPLAVTLGED